MTQPEARRKRRASKVEEFGFDAECSQCGENEVLTLHKVSTNRDELILCASCRAEFRSKAPTESHHVMGQHNGNLTVSIPPNDHAILSDYQYDWPKDTLRNPSGSPLRIVAALLRGWMDLLELVMSHVRSWITFLENLDIILAAKLGTHWWVEIPALEKQP